MAFVELTASAAAESIVATRRSAASAQHVFPPKPSPAVYLRVSGGGRRRGPAEERDAGTRRRIIGFRVDAAVGRYVREAPEKIPARTPVVSIRISRALHELLLAERPKRSRRL